MIIRCPECSTGFELPDDRVTPEGTKLKCSRCDHVFRVRGDGEGEPEIFYQPHDNQDQDESPKESDGNPFPHAGLDIKPKKASAFGDLDSDKGEMDAFESAFEQDQEEATELEAVVDEDSEPDEEQNSQASTSSPAKQSASKAALATAEPKQEEEEQSALMGSGGDFGSPEDHVDDSFGEGGPYFDPKKGKVEAGANSGNGPQKPDNSPKKPGGAPKPAGAKPPAGASGPPPTQAAKKKAPSTGPSSASKPPQSQSASSPASQPQSADPPSGWDDDDLAPHKIGGGAGQKLVAILLLLSLVIMSFGGVVAYLNDGFIDFQALDEMLEVAFAEGEYQPREEWTDDGPTTVIRQSADPVAVEGVHAELVSIRGGDHLFVVQGMVRNNQESRIHDVELRGMVMTPEQRSLREVRGLLGEEDPSVGEFRALRDIDDAQDLLSSEADAVVGSGELKPFTLVFSDVPQRVIDGERFTYRVEIASTAGGDSE